MFLLLRLLGEAVALAGMLMYAWWLWYGSIFQRRHPHCLAIYTQTFRFSALLVLYFAIFAPGQDGKWAYSTLPELVASTTHQLDAVVLAFPQDLTLEFNTTEQRLMAHSPSSLDTFSLQVEYQVWKNFTAPMRQSPLAELLRCFHSPASLFQFLYRLANIQHGGLLPMLHAGGGKRSNEADWNSGLVIENYREFQIGETVQQKLGKGGAPRKVSAYFPSNYLYEFKYLLQDEEEEVPLAELDPLRLNLYFINTTRLPALPLDATVVLTPTHIALLQGYSHHFGDYWQRTPVDSPPAPAPLSKEDGQQQQCRAQIDPAPWNAAGMCHPLILEQNGRKMWHPISIETIMRDNALRLFGALFCTQEDADGEVFTCSRDIAQNKVEHLRASFHPFFSPHSTAVWFLFFFALQTMVVASLSILFAAIVFGPACALVTTLFCMHAEDVRAIGYLSSVHSSLRAFQAFLLLSHCARSTRLHLLLFHLAANCFALYLRRTEHARGLDATRKHLLLRHAKRRPGRARRSSEVPVTATCRICFGGGNSYEEEDEEEQLISPCLCDGSMQYVHASCLREWRLRSGNKHSYARCDQCKFPYRIHRTWKETVLRSTLVLLLLALTTQLVLILLGALGFKLVEEYGLGGSTIICELFLGAKACAYVKEGAWELGEVTNATERYWIEFWTARLRVVDLGHLIPSFACWGIIGFFLGDFYAVPWDIGPHEEGLAIFFGGRFLIVICVGHFRLLWTCWSRWKLRSAAMLASSSTGAESGGGGGIENVPIVEWFIPPGTLLRTPFGFARVLRHRVEEDDVVEMELAGGRGEMLYRTATESAAQDVEI